MTEFYTSFLLKTVSTTGFYHLILLISEVGDQFLSMNQYVYSSYIHDIHVGLQKIIVLIKKTNTDVDRRDNIN